MNTNFQDVVDFHSKFLVPHAGRPSLLDPSTQEFREKFLYEELREMGDSYVVGDLEGVADALVDLVYVALGTAHMMGLPWQQLWDSVQKANMTKRLAKPDGSDSKRKSPLDVVKPPGWVGPDHKEALGLSNGVVQVFNAQAEVALRAQARQVNSVVPKPGQAHTIGADWTPVKLVILEKGIWMVHQGRYVTQVEETDQLWELFGENTTMWFMCRSVNGILTLGENTPDPEKGQSC